MVRGKSPHARLGDGDGHADDFAGQEGGRRCRLDAGEGIGEGAGDGVHAARWPGGLRRRVTSCRVRWTPKAFSFGPESYGANGPYEAEVVGRKVGNRRVRKGKEGCYEPSKGAVLQGSLCYRGRL